MRGSAKDKNGQKINDTHLPMCKGVYYEKYETYDNYNNEFPGYQQTCITYTVEYSFGQVGYSMVCFVSYYSKGVLNEDFYVYSHTFLSGCMVAAYLKF